MFRNRQSLVLIILPALLCFAGFSIALADAEKSTAKCYIDLDGDGFDDNAVDNNNDGIPDLSDNQDNFNIRGMQESDSKMVDFDFGTSEIELSYSKIYSLNCAPTCGMTKTRGGFGMADEFGPGNGIGLGALSSGGCSGGVCRP